MTVHITNLLQLLCIITAVRADECTEQPTVTIVKFMYVAYLWDVLEFESK